MNAQPFKGKFIVVDGPDYTGKGTLIRALVPYLMNHPKDRNNKLITVVATREPWNTNHTMQLRDIFAGRKIVPTDDLAKVTTGLFVADRRVHAPYIRANLEAGAVVLCDRYEYSTDCYQSSLHNGVSMDKLIAMHKGLPVPDLSIFLNVPVEVRLKRKAVDRNRPFEELFDKDEELQRNLDDAYIVVKKALTVDAHLYSREPHNIVWVNANQAPHLVFEEAKAYVDACLFPKAN